MSLPTFMTTGVPRAATTWLDGCLRAHPEIYMPEYKEMHFFIPHAGRDLYSTHGLDFYRRFYRGGESYGARGEVQTLYFASPHAPARIASVLPHVKLLVMLRDPSERLWSHYHYDMNRAPASRVRPVEDLLRDPTSFKQCLHGFYARHLRAWLRHFPREAVKIVLMEDVVARPESTLKEITDFIGVSAAPLDPSTASVKNAARTVRSRRLHGALHRAWGTLAPAGLDGLRRTIKRTGVPARIKRWMSKPAPNLPLPPEGRAALVRVYRDDLLELQSLIGRDLSPWLA